MAKSTPAEIAARKARFAELPWVKEITDPATRCEGVKWGQVAMQDIYEHGPQSDPRPPRGIQERARCKRRAVFRYRIEPSATATRTVNGLVHEADLCWTHASIVLYETEGQYARLKRWLARQEKNND